MLDFPSVAVVILNWNGKKFLQQFLPSLITHTSIPNCRIIVADNASIDGSVDFLTQNFPQIETLVFDKNYGFTGGYNKALAQIEAEYFVILNSDIEVSSNWLSPLILFLQENKKVAAVQPKILAFHNKQQFEYAGASGGFIDYLGYPYCRGRMLDTVETDLGQYDNPMQVFWATGACMVVRATDFTAAGGFANDFFAHMEEIDLCWRLQQMGKEVWCIPQSTVYHVGGGTLPNKHPFKIFLNHRNSLFMLFRNIPGLRVYFILFVRMLLDGVSAAIYVLQGNPAFLLSVLKSHLAFYKAMPSLRIQRRMIQSTGNAQLPGTMRKESLLWNYFVRKIKKFSDLK